MKLLRDGYPVGVADIFEHLPAKRAVTYRRETGLQLVEKGVTREAGILRAEALRVAKGIVVDQTDQAIELHERILKRRGCQQNLRRVRKGSLQGAAGFVVGAIDTPEAMRLVDNGKVPFRDHELVALAGRELGGTDDDRRLLERLAHAVFPQAIIGCAFEDRRRKEEFFGHLLRPLLAQVGRADDENAALPLGPFLGQH